MKRLIPTLSLFCAVLSSASAFAAKPSDRSEVIVADELRSAFYEKAPPRVAVAISKAVGAWCASGERRQFADKSKANGETIGWLCGSEKLHFYRSVYLTGARGAHAAVCENDSKYMGIDMVNELIEFGACVPAESEENKTYQLYFGAVNTRSSP
jgi:hypothetical protein